MNASHSNRSVPINNQKVLQDEETKKKFTIDLIRHHHMIREKKFG